MIPRQLSDIFAECIWDVAWSISQVGYLTLADLDDVLGMYCSGWEL